MPDSYPILRKMILLGVLVVLTGCAPAGQTTTVPGQGNLPGVDTWTPLATNTLEPEPTSAATATSTFLPTPNFMATKIAAGRRHTCVITDRRTVKCWGDNEDGQLGDETTI